MRANLKVFFLLAFMGVSLLEARDPPVVELYVEGSRPAHLNSASSRSSSATRSDPYVAPTFKENPYPNTTLDPKDSRKIMNVAADRIVNSLGCVVGANDPDVLKGAVKTWGKEIQKLGKSPKQITSKTSYATTLKFIVWDYLDDAEVCGSTRKDCYVRLHKPLEKLFTLFREYDLRDNNVEKEIKRRVDELNQIVKELRADGSKIPPCLIDKKVAKSPDPRPPYTGHPQTPPPTKPDVPVSTGDLGKHEAAFINAGANPAGVRKALAYFAQNKSKFSNQKYLSFIDYSKSGSTERYFLLNTQTGEVKRFKVAHGQGKGKKENSHGTPKHFSNEHGSKLSSLGAYKVSEIDNGNPNLSYKQVTWLDGLESTNSRARKRGAYMHAAWYVSQNGRSSGCPSLTKAAFDYIQPKISGGSFLYMYAP